MSDYKPTFKVSPAKRPWYQRLTPFAWAMIGVVMVVVVLGITAGVLALSNRPAPEEPWQPDWTPTPTVPPTATPSPTPTLPPSVWWADQMVEDEQGHLQPPPEVQDQVWEAFITGLGCVYIPDRDALPEESHEQIVRRATAFLTADEDVWYVACNGATTLSEATSEMRPLILVEFGPRNVVICDESPTRCRTAVSAVETGVVVYLEEACQKHANSDAPCILRPPVFTVRSGRALFIGDLKYEGEADQWKIVGLERKEL